MAKHCCWIDVLFVIHKGGIGKVERIKNKNYCIPDVCNALSLKNSIKKPVSFVSYRLYINRALQLNYLAFSNLLSRLVFPVMSDAMLYQYLASSKTIW